MNDEAGRMINQQSCRGWCSCSSGTRYDLARRAEEKTVIINELLNEGRSFNDVSDPSLPSTEILVPINQDFEVFASRESIRNEVMVALKDEGTNLIGVYGMGGVGKTTLMNQVGKQAKEENLFDEVVMTTVSQNIDLKRMQNEIAEHLGLKQLKAMDSITARAALLSQRLKQENRILVILDDLWSMNLELSEVGIPYGEIYHRGCKVVITTRILDVCNSLCSQKNINVAVLSEEESWHLFKKNVGDDANSPVLQSVAKEIAKECGGLPVALVTLGRALRNKDKVLWDDAAFQLKRSNFRCIDQGMSSVVFASIKLSYDYLGYEMIKKCFLLCCLFPEDYKIDIHELMEYAMGDDGILEDSETLARASSRIYAILDKLLASSLLIGDKNYGGKYVVWMYDIVRDVAILIASEEAKGFFVKAGIGLSDWPERIRFLPSGSSSICKCLRLSLMGNEISVLPEEPELPLLSILSLQWNRYLMEIPANFFGKMCSLEILDLRNTGISSLPSSLSFLVNLRTLYLDYCNLSASTDISLIGKLNRLVILSLKGCNLKRLPGEIKGLTNLKSLNLSENDDLATIPPIVISSLSSLESLNLDKCDKIRWALDFDNELMGNGSNSSLLVEVASLPCLTNLVLQIRNKEIATEDCEHVYIQTFNVVFYDELDVLRFDRLDNTKSLLSSKDYFLCEVSHPVSHSMKVLMQRVRQLDLHNCIGLKSIGQLVIDDGFTNMRSLSIDSCGDMEYLMNMTNEEEKEIPRTALASLKKLNLVSMDKLKYIFYGPVPIGFLDNLKVLKLCLCEDMVSLFGPNLVKRVPNLVELKVAECGMLKDVFNLETGTSTQTADEEISTTATTILSKLTSIFLFQLGNLETIWKGEIIPFRFLDNLKELVIEYCPRLSCLFSSHSMARNLQQLERLKVHKCNSMVKLIATLENDRQMVQEPNDQVLILFPNLKHLDIENCRSLEQLWDYGKNSSTLVLDCPLEDLYVVKCDNLKTRIRLTHQCTLQLKEIVGNEDWFHQGLECEDPGDKLHLEPLFKVGQ